MFSTTTIEDLKTHAQELKIQGHFRPAFMGSPSTLKKNQELRGDEIHWIDNWENPLLTEVNDIYEKIILRSKAELFLAIKSFESHFSSYVDGTHYTRHVDQHLRNKRRLLSSVLYLSPWRESNGGELYIYPKNSKEIKICPLPGRLIVFRSDLEHEVKITNSDRWSIATWFRDDISSLHL